MVDLKNYVVINESLVASLARQLNLPVDKERTSESQFGLVGKIGIGFKKSTHHSALPSADPRLLAPIIAALRESGQLRIYRPGNTRKFWEDPNSWYVHETAIAQPVLLPFDKTKPRAAYFPEAVTIWIFCTEDMGYLAHANTIWSTEPQVFIVQELTSFPQPATYISGISAVRIIKEVLADPSVADFEEWQDQYTARGGADFRYKGRGNPVDDLMRLGGIVGRPRKIETVYKIAYMAHQETITAGERVGDIFAYPLFIAE